MRDGLACAAGAHRLAGLTGESANLAVLTNGCAEYVSQAPGSHAMRIFTEVGNRAALHCPGVGKALLASIPPDQARQLIGVRCVAVAVSALQATSSELYRQLA
jgi:IclR family acetate operon transcriptional repressor